MIDVTAYCGPVRTDGKSRRRLQVTNGTIYFTLALDEAEQLVTALKERLADECAELYTDKG